MKKIYNFICLSLLFVITNSCIQVFDAGTEEFEDVIVIKATITDEFKNQKITLTRTYNFEEKETKSETGAIVKVTTSNNDEFNFSETTPGVYISNSKFKAIPNLDYTLVIMTKNGKEYKSTNTQLTNASSIENVYALKVIDEDGVEGIGIYVDSFDATNNSKYYGYEFEETYKIIVPNWTPEDLILTPSGDFSVVPRTQEEQTCYNTVKSEKRLLTKTTLLQEDRVSKFLLKFIPSDDISLNTRYSILVKQYIQSNESYNYFKVLEEFSNSQSLFSQTQPGFFNSNIFFTSNSNEKVLGFFEISTVSEKRIFFDRLDILNEPFSWPCEIIAPPASELRELLLFDSVTFVRKKDFGDTGGPYKVVKSVCGDCTRSGSNIKPFFWID